jgi:hypothetical protein
MAVAAALVVVTASLTMAIAAQADETTVSIDTLRTAWDPAEPTLSPANVTASDFGTLFDATVDGQVYAQPLVIGDEVVVTTENAKAYGLDKETGAIRWTRAFGTPFAAASIGCGDLTPNLGSTSTPVFDPSSNTVYLTTKLADGPDAQHPHWYLQAVDATTGADRPGFPVTIQGTPQNTPGIPFQAFTAMQRPGLLLLDGVVYMGFGAHCDIEPYRGYVVGVSTTAHAMTTMWSDEAGSGADESSEAGIWQSGGGLVSDGPGRIYLTTGNGISPPPSPGHTPPQTLAESVIRLAVNGDGSLAPQDFFAPADAPTLDQNDTDLGSGGPVALPSAYFGSATHPNLMVQVGKDGRVFLLDRDDLGGRKQGPGGTDNVLGMSGPYNGVWGHPAAYGGEGGWVYDVENSGFLRAFSAGVNGSGVPTLTSAGTSSGTFGYTSGSPVVTSDGTTPGSAIVWVEYSTGSGGGGGQLRAYRALPSGGTLALLWSAPIGTASKFAVPATSGGRVYIGTRDGHVMAFGRPASAALQTSPIDFGQTGVGTTAKASTTVTATRDVTVTAVSTAAPFAVSAKNLPVLLHAGDTLLVSARFSPTVAGDASGQATVSTDVGDFALDLHGYGTAPGLLASPPALDFGTIAVGGGGKTLAVSITNSSTRNERITAVTDAAAPFTTTGLPAVGTSLASGASVTVAVTYTPTVAGSDAGSLTVTSDHGGVTVALNGTAISGQAHLTLTPTTTDFGKVVVGGTRTLTFDISNTGNIPLTLTKAKAPAGVFSTSTPVSEGITLAPGAVVHQTVTFAPAALGKATGSYLITADDGQGQQTEHLVGRGTATVPPPPTGWQLNGTAAAAKGGAELTGTVGSAAGSVVYPVPVASDGLDVTFTAFIGNGTGADGLTFALLDASQSTAASLGFSGGGLAFGGLHGVAVALDTYQNATDPSANFVGVSTGGVSGDTSSLVWAQTNTAIPSLRGVPHVVHVTVSGGELVVTLDGASVLDTAVALPSSALLAFTGGTGGLTDNHRISKVTITTA